MTIDEARAEVLEMMLGDGPPVLLDEVQEMLDALVQAVRDEEHERLGATIHAPIDADFFVTHIRLGGRTIEVMPPEPLGGGTVTEITWVEAARLGNIEVTQKNLDRANEYLPARPLEPASPTD